MTNTQLSTKLPPRISIFDKRGQANLTKVSIGPKANINKTKVNLPQFRINQHKGA